jgi:ribosomal protein S18 acetylase RimI-like enzyme
MMAISRRESSRHHGIGYDETRSGHRHPVYRPGDRSAVETCIVTLQDHERALQPDRRRARTIASGYRQLLLRRCRQGPGRICVATVAEEIVGFVCFWRVCETGNLVTTPTDYTYVSDLVVRPGWRRRGVGRALMRRADGFARRHGTGALRVNVLARNAGAWRFYRRAGFADYEVSLVKRLRPR